MLRRKFIKDAALSISYMMFLSSIVGCKEKEMLQINTNKKILIIGAGIAGLAAAKYFKERGVEVVLIEAQEKVGGRLRTDRSVGVAFDEGASWIHGPEGNPITALATAAAATTFLTDDDNSVVFDVDGTLYADSVLTTEEAAFEAAVDAIEGELDESFMDAFYAEYPAYENNRLWTYMLSAFLEFDTGADISRLSSLDFYDDEAFDGDDLIITNGFDKIANFLATDIDIRLNTKVERINYEEDSIHVFTDQATFEADYVLLTVPLGVLKNDVISFMPSLPHRIQSAIDHLEMGSVNKFLCVWDTAFWDTDLQYIGYTPEEKGKFNYFLNAGKFTDANALMTFAFGDYSKTTETMTDAEIVEEIMSHLKTIYGDNIPNPTTMLRTKWVRNEFTFGSYSFATNGTRSTDFEAFEEQVENKIFFAGEHTSLDYRGTVHGAYLSGIREAEKIADLL